MSTPIFEHDDQVVLILVGLIASGKSTFAQALEQHFPKFRTCNQDELGDRRKAEQFARKSLQQGLSVCVDRTNFNPQQRSYWINIAREFSVPVWVIVFDTPYDVCVERLRERRNHPTITEAQQGLMVLDRFRSQFEAPTSLEGYDRIITLTASDFPSPQHTLVETSAIIERLRSSVPESTSIISHNFRARGGWRRAAIPPTHSWRGKSSLSSDGQQSTTQVGGRRYTKGRGGFSSESRDYDWRGNRTLP